MKIVSHFVAIALWLSLYGYCFAAIALWLSLYGYVSLYGYHFTDNILRKNLNNIIQSIKQLIQNKIIT